MFRSSTVDKLILTTDSLKNLYFAPFDSFISKNKNISKSFVNLYKAEINEVGNYSQTKDLQHQLNSARINFAYACETMCETGEEGLQAWAASVFALRLGKGQ